MKKFLKRVLCIFMVTVTFLVSCGFTNLVQAGYENDLPIVYVKGRGRTIYSAKGKQLYPFTESVEDQIMEQSDVLVDAAQLSMLTGNWDTFCNKVVEIVDPIFKELRLNNDGEATDGSYIIEASTPKVKKSGYYLYDYVFEYDSRLDPVAVSTKLNKYINKVLERTGKKKVQLVGRCLGSSIVASYLSFYGMSKVDSVLFYVPSAMGTLLCGELFAGKLKFNANTIDYYVNNHTSDAEVSGGMKTFLSIMTKLQIVGIGTSTVQSIYNKIYKNIMPRLILSSYGTMPAYWSMVGEPYYEEAKELIFGNDTAKYAKLIKKIDNYHYNVQQKLYSKLKNFKKNGLKIAVIAKYDTMLIPILESSNKQADGLVELETLSFGATSANFRTMFSESYINKAQQRGKDKYISSDRIVDASTCLFPDNTWFIKDQVHGKFPSSVNYLMYEFFHKKAQLTVWNSSYPQFMDYIAKGDKLVDLKYSYEEDSNSQHQLQVIINLAEWFAKIVRILFRR